MRPERIADEDPVMTEAADVVASLLPGFRVQRCDLLKRGKSAVFALYADGDLPVVVAKLAMADTVALEDRILAWLGTSPLPAIRTFGAVPATSSGLAWLVSEFASGAPFDSHAPEHRARAAAWLGDLHAWAATAPRPSLPLRDADYHRAVVMDAHAVLNEAWQSGGYLTDDEREAVRGLANLSGQLRDRWESVTRVLEPLPSTLVHSGIAGKNMRLVKSRHGVMVLAFDWEQGGWGCPAADLSTVDLAVYSDRMSRHGLELPALVEVGLIGRALWCLAGVPGERVNLLGEWPHRAARKVDYYRQHVHAAVGTLGWSVE